MGRSTSAIEPRFIAPHKIKMTEVSTGNEAMNGRRTRLASVYVTCLTLLIAADIRSFGEVLMLIDDEDSIKLFFDDAKFWDDSKRKDTRLELLADKSSFPTEADRKGAVVAFRGPGNTGNDVGYLARSGLLKEGFALIAKNPVESNEFRYFTAALKHDGKKSCMLIGIIGFPGFSHNDDVHKKACWDHRLSFGKHRNCADWNDFSFTSVTEDAAGNDHGDTLPADWTFYIIDLAEWAERDCIYNNDCKKGNWRFEAWDFEADHPEDVGGTAYFDAMYLTQTRREAVDLGRQGFAVLAVDKVTTTWGKIKAQY